MSIKANYSVKEETDKMVRDIAEKTYRTQGAVVDMAIANLAQTIFAEDGAVDLLTTPARPASRPSRRTRKITEPQIDRIPGVRRGMSKEAV